MLRSTIKVFSVTLLSSFVLVGCGGSSTTTDNTELDIELVEMMRVNNISGDPASERDLPDISEPLPQLGKLLFFSKALSGDQDTACVSCHHPMLGGGDDLPLAIGVAAVDPDLLGPGRIHDPFGIEWDGGPTMPRNVPTVFNVGLHDQAMFWDGRVSSIGKTPNTNGDDGLGIQTPDSGLDLADPNVGDTLADAVAHFPILPDVEMRGFEFGAGQGNIAIRDRLAARIGNYGDGLDELATNNWLPEFQKAFQRNETAESLITYNNIGKAIGEYMRSQTFVSIPWREYAEGDSEAISKSAKRGALLFFKPIEDKGANCASCHSGDFFTDELNHVVAVPQIGRGKGNGITGDDDFGRFNETQDLKDMYAFRTPTLLNVTATGPWGHSGAFESLESMVRHHLNVEESVAAFDYLQISQEGIQTSNALANTENAVDQLLAYRASNTQNVLQDAKLSESEVGDLLAFLGTLTDPCVEDRECVSPWIAENEDPNPDNLRVIAIDVDGNLL
ncbi:MAG: cytochrome c peroxidase [Cocleimonas sp.]